MLARLEGSRRALKGGVIENLVSSILGEIFTANNWSIKISEKEIRLEDETYDIVLTGSQNQILCPVKTRETMGGGHALLFTRDIHKAITVAAEAGHTCLPIGIAESWTGDLGSLPCDHFVFVQHNPNQLDAIRQELVEQFRSLLELFKSLD
jgi:hypothetical protein